MTAAASLWLLSARGRSGSARPAIACGDAVLILICGPTGVGKTTLMARLAAAHGMGVVTTWTTRPPRPLDRFKISLDAAAYRSAALGFLWPDQRLYGHFYGEDYAQVMAAACPSNREPWLIDMALETLGLFDAIPHRRLVLLPAELGFLAVTLARAGRPERLATAIEEEAAWRAAIAVPRLGTAMIPCRLGAAEAVAVEAAAVIGRWVPQADSGD